MISVIRVGEPPLTLFALLLLTSEPMSLCSVQPSSTWTVCTGPHLHLQGTVGYWNPYGLPLTQRIPSGPGYLLHGVPSSLGEDLSLMLDRSHLQRLRVSVLFPVPLSMPTSQDRDPSYSASLPSGSTALAAVSQRWSSWVTRGSTQLAAEIFSHHRSPGDRDWVIISSPASSSCCEGPASSLSLPVQTDLVLDFFFCIGGTAPSTGCSHGAAAVWPWSLLLCCLVKSSV